MRARRPRLAARPAAVALAALIAAVACAGPAGEAPPEGGVAPLGSVEAPLGSVEAPPGGGEAPRRIIAVAPSVAEILFALDLGERVVGVGDYADWPPAAAAKPRIGGLFDPRFEEIVALAPDLAVLLPSEERLAGELARLGVETLTVRHETLAEVEQSIVTIARRTGVEGRGRELAAELERGLAPRRRDPPPRVLLLVAREPRRLAQLTAVGSGTFLAEIVERLGAVNVLADLGQPYPQIGLETVLERRPQVIVELQPEPPAPAAAAALVGEWDRFPEVPAVAAGCVVVVGGGHVLLPGPRLPRLARDLERALDGCSREAAR